MQKKSQLLFDPFTRNAHLVYDGQVYYLGGPFISREHADRAAQEVMTRMVEAPAVEEFVE